MSKISAYARDPESQKNNVKRLKGTRFLRLRIGAFRAVIAEDRETVKVIDLGPRGSIYD
jgi:mRNA interferase RelE/StbE